MTTEQKIIKTKVGVLELAKQFGNVSRACQVALRSCSVTGRDCQGKARPDAPALGY